MENVELCAMINRAIHHDILEIVEHFPALMLVGPRQIGKTTLAKEMGKRCGKAWHYFDLENPNHRFALENNPIDALASFQNDLVVLDEVQCLPAIFSALRSLIDEHRMPGRFILTGSADPALVKGVSESLAGRMIYKEMAQLNLLEAVEAGIAMETHWFRGGFPEALLFKSEKLFNIWVKSFIESYVHRDLNTFFGINLNPIQVAKLWGMVAHLNSGVENMESLGRSLGMTGTTVKKYLDFMQGSYLVRRLPPWFENHGKRLVKSPKIYLRTSGILHHMLLINNFDELLKHPALGASWEGYVIEQIAACKPEGIDLYYYRTHQGAEMDLVLVKGMRPTVGIEIKFSNQPVLGKGFFESAKDLKTVKNYVITPHSLPFVSSEGVNVCGLVDFLHLLKENRL